MLKYVALIYLALLLYSLWLDYKSRKRRQAADLERSKATIEELKRMRSINNRGTELIGAWEKEIYTWRKNRRMLEKALHQVQTKPKKKARGKKRKKLQQIK